MLPSQPASRRQLKKTAAGEPDPLPPRLGQMVDMVNALRPASGAP